MTESRASGYTCGMSADPTVSVVIIFLNEEEFLSEAIESVLAQRYSSWELLIVDDGSTDGSSKIARTFASGQPDRIRYLEHPGHANRGVSASRNLGSAHARGKLVAFLDGDDVWLPEKLEEQVAFMDAYPDAEMLYGRSRYWFGWTGSSNDARRDFVPPLGIPSETVVDPPGLLAMFLSGDAAVPCPSDIIVRRDALLAAGGFDESFLGIHQVYEDQAFYSKFCLVSPVLVVERCWILYRQHPSANTARTRATGKDLETRLYFLNWLKKYLADEEVTDRILWRTLHEQLWLAGHPGWLPVSLRRHWRWGKKWILRSGLIRSSDHPETPAGRPN